MSREVYASALQNALTEIRNVCPDVQTSFLFDKDATLVAGDSETPETAPGRVIESLKGVLDKAETLGGFESTVIQGSKGSIHISRVNDMYLTIIASKAADLRYVETVGRVLIPTVIRLLDTSNPAPLQHPSSPPSLLDSESEEDLNIDENTDEKDEDERRCEPHEDADTEDSEPEELDETESSSNLELPSNQLIVESFGGLLVRSDTVQISGEIMSQWETQLMGKHVETVIIESFNGKASQCKVKTLKDSKLENKAVIRIPQKLCQTLDIKKGELVRVKPLPS
jgi:predicted regulator of Ras-like GTPase activity (Roadblock/LC7/MglB family)